MSKKSGRHSQSANDFLKPNAPTIGTATDIGTDRPYNNGAVSITFTHNGPYDATSYTASGYCSVHDAIHTATGSSSPLTITGFGVGSTPTITVTATNDYGTSDASQASNQVTVTTVPQTPAAPGATSPNANEDIVTWSAPNNGGKSISNYHWESDDGKSGDTAALTVTVAQEAGTAQTYRLYATNANGNSTYSSTSGSVTTTFSFVPFGAFGFVPFGFVPFGAFGFTPFGFTPFGFTPFGFTPFGFTPFSAFGFTPFGAFGFSPPRCIHEDTLIETVNGPKPAKEIQVGDVLKSVGLQEVPLTDGVGTADFDYVGFESDTLTTTGQVEVNVSAIESQSRTSVIWFNGDSSKKYSLTQPIFIKKNNKTDKKYEIIPTTVAEVGDSLIQINNDGNISEIEITSIDHELGEFTVYQFSCEPQDWFVAGSYLVHNK
jgi:hypothetical protein